LSQIGLYNNTLDEMYRKIGSYIGQGLNQQQNQPVVPQPVQNQPMQPKRIGPNSPLQPLAKQQPAPQQQRANQPQQNQVPYPHRITP